MDIYRLPSSSSPYPIAMTKPLLKLFMLAAPLLVSAETTWSENLVLADCGKGLGPNGGSTSREMMYYSGAAWGAPTYMANVPWDGSYPWRGSGVTQTLPNGDTWTVYIDNTVKDPGAAGVATHTYDKNMLICWARHLDGLFTLNDGKKCSMAFICNHAPVDGGSPKPSPKPPAPAPGPPPPKPSPRRLEENATPAALKFQPVIDFDKTACYNTWAIASDGTVNPGIELGEGDCRSIDRLSNSNVYVREKCSDDGWCFYLYGYYAEKDQGGALGGGHKHDWEHLGVWARDGAAKYYAWSHHGDYTVDWAEKMRYADGRAKFVVERDRATTHAFRVATESEPAENGTGKWVRSLLVSIERMDGKLREKLLGHNWGSADPDLKDDRFERAYWETWKQVKRLQNLGPVRPDLPGPPMHREL
jgi:hypothetical protein